MKKITITLLLFLLLASGIGSQKLGKPIDFIKQLKEGDTLSMFETISCSDHTTQEILIYKSKNSFWIERHGDPLFVGTKQEPVWKKKLNRRGIRRINQYINHVKNQNTTRIYLSGAEDVKVTVNGKTLASHSGARVFGFEIEGQLFSQEYKQLEKKLQLRADSLKQLFQGIFYPGTLTEDSTGQYLFLSRQYEFEISYSPDCVWEFILPHQFKSRCQVFDFESSEDYFWISNGKVELQTRSSWYEILKITPEGILLKNAFPSQKTPPRN